MLDWNGYWDGGLNNEEQLVIQGLVAEIERWHGTPVPVEKGPISRGPRQGQYVHVLDSFWTEGCDGQGRAD